MNRKERRARRGKPLPDVPADVPRERVMLAAVRAAVNAASAVDGRVIGAVVVVLRAEEDGCVSAHGGASAPADLDIAHAYEMACEALRTDVMGTPGEQLSRGARATGPQSGGPN